VISIPWASVNVGTLPFCTSAAQSQRNAHGCGVSENRRNCAIVTVCRTDCAAFGDACGFRDGCDGSRLDVGSRGFETLAGLAPQPPVVELVETQRADLGTRAAFEVRLAEVSTSSTTEMTDAGID